MRVSRHTAYWLALAAAVLFIALPVNSEKTKTLSGKVRSLKENRMVVQKSGLLNESEVVVELTDTTKKTGQVAPGMHVKVKYREEKTPAGETRRVAVEIAARPEYASKEAKHLAKEQKTQPE
ncbi:MAG: hypothetical protein ACRD5F_13895 [Candidatus Acidiferrales bacterium]